MTNLFLTMLILTAAQGGPMNPNSERFQLRDRAVGVTPVTGMFLIPPKIPDCRTQAQVDEALKARQSGDLEQCDPERFLKSHR